MKFLGAMAGCRAGALSALLALAGVAACDDDGAGGGEDGGTATGGSAPASGGGGGTPGTGGMSTGGAGPADSGADAEAPRFDVTTESGVVTGKLIKGTRAFLGIPYAAPPVGENRWKAPQPVEPWSAPLDATEPANVCPQIRAGGTDTDPRSDEDCLTLNVWTPDPAPASPLPVMVWIHGGAFFFGSGAESFYDGDLLVKKGDVVVVTMNYRIGALGFFAHPALNDEDEDHPTSGNYGFEDQQLALKWVKDNIGAFGGDPDQVTLFGESAGGYSVCAHLIAPGSRGLFHRAISQSGFCSSGFSSTIEEAYPNSEALVRNLGCSGEADVLACMRGKSPSEMLHVYDGVEQQPGGLFFQAPVSIGDGGIQGSNRSWKPLTDGVVLPTYVTEVNADTARVPFIIGTNADEGTLFSNLFGGKPVADATEYQEALSRIFTPTQVTDIVQRYPIASYESPGAALDVVANDAGFACPARRLARELAAEGVDVYVYAFHHVPLQGLLPTLGSFHAAELAYVFGYDTVLTVTQESEKPLGEAMRGYWTRFAKTGDPNGDGAPMWPKYAAASDEYLGLELPEPEAETGYKKDACDFWDSIYVP